MDREMFKPPAPLNLGGNIASNWKKFKQKFEIFLEACDKEDASQKKKLAIFLNCIGDDGLELYNTFTFKKDQEDKYKSVLQLFEEYCAPKGNVIFERFLFNSIVQDEGQSIDAFILTLKTKVKSCDYDKPDEMVRDRLVLGVLDKQIQERLLRESKLTLEDAIRLSKSIESTKVQIKKITNQEEEAVELCSSVQSKLPVYKRTKQTFQESRITGVPSTTDRNGQGMKRNSCWRCGSYCEFRKCPAFNSKCWKCDGKGHFSRVCGKKVDIVEFNIEKK